MACRFGRWITCFHEIGADLITAAAAAPPRSEKTAPHEQFEPGAWVGPGADRDRGYRPAGSRLRSRPLAPWNAVGESDAGFGGIVITLIRGDRLHCKLRHVRQASLTCSAPVRGFSGGLLGAQPPTGNNRGGQGDRRINLFRGELSGARPHDAHSWNGHAGKRLRRRSPRRAPSPNTAGRPLETPCVRGQTRTGRREQSLTGQAFRCRRS